MEKGSGNGRNIGVSYTDKDGCEHYMAREVRSGVNVGDYRGADCNFNAATGRSSGRAFFNIRERLDGQLGVGYCAAGSAEREGRAFVRYGDANTYKFQAVPLDVSQSLPVMSGGAVKIVPGGFIADDGSLRDGADEHSHLFEMSE